MILPALVRLATRGKLTIFIFHRVLPALDELRPDEPDATRFEAEIRWIADWFDIRPLTEAVALLRGGRLRSPTAALTFDDGYKDNLEIALPILRNHGATATFFISTGFTGGGCMFNDVIIEAVRAAAGPLLDLTPAALGTWPLGSLVERRQAIAGLLQSVKYMTGAQRADAVAAILEAAGASPPADLMMNAKELRTLAEAGMSIGAHTRTHPILARLTLDQARDEISDGRTRLSEITGRPVDAFAYPNGVPGRDYSREHVDLVRNLGFAVACSTRPGVANSASDRLQLPRFRPWDRGKTAYALRLCRNAWRDY